LLRLACSFFVLLCMVLAGCSVAPLTSEAAKTALEASKDFQPQKAQILLTEDEVKRGTDAGYWHLSSNPASAAFGGILLLTDSGANYFRGAPMRSRPFVHPLQELGQRVVVITAIEDVPENKREKQVSYTWTWRFENMLPELADLFKDQPPQTAQKTFQYSHGMWELKP